MLSQIVWLVAGLAWGTIKIVVRRTEVSLDEESAWGFGQMLAVFVSILPIWTIFQGINGKLLIPGLRVENWADT